MYGEQNIKLYLVKQQRLWNVRDAEKRRLERTLNRDTVSNVGI